MREFVPIFIGRIPGQGLVILSVNLLDRNYFSPEAPDF